MTILQYILPILLFLGAVGCAFIDVKQSKGLIIGGVTAVLLLIILGFDIYLAAAVNGEKKQLAAEVKERLVWQKRSVANLQTILATFSPERDKTTREMKALVNLGWTTNNTIFNESFNADKEFKRLIEAVSPPKKPVTISNLPANIDIGIFKLAMTEVGHLVDIPGEEEDFDESDEDAFEEEEDDEEEFEDETPGLQEANVMFYGKAVRNSDIKLIAYALMRSGVQLRMLRPYKKLTKDNVRSVELDWSKLYKSRPPITVKSIVKAKSFKR
ncbi:MAG: hypothetical protein JKY24_07880 [Pseudomonadales bacterium]|nr:hypothetical protein [Pseudomonadales bacterium]